MPAIFTIKRGSSQDMDDLVYEDGAVIVTTDKNEMYVDMDNQRRFTGSFQVVETLPSRNVSKNRICYQQSDKKFYQWNGTEREIIIQQIDAEKLLNYATDDDIVALFNE